MGQWASREACVHRLAQVSPILDSVPLDSCLQSIFQCCLGSAGIDPSSPGPPPPLKTRSVLRGDDVLLPCDQPSNLARALWLLNGSKSLSDGQDGYRVGVDGLLVTDTQLEHSGNYGCYAEENGLRMLLASYSLTVRPATPAPAPQAPATPGAQLAHDMRMFYVVAIAILGGLCLILASSLLYVACLKGGRRGRRRKYSLGRAGRAGGSAVQLQTVSGQCPMGWWHCPAGCEG